MSTSLFSFTNSMPITKVALAMTIGYHSPLWMFSCFSMWNSLPIAVFDLAVARPCGGVSRQPAVMSFGSGRSLRRCDSCVHTLSFSRSAILPQPAISSMLRRQPSHQRFAASIRHSPTQGLGTQQGSLGNGGRLMV